MADNSLPDNSTLETMQDYPLSKFPNIANYKSPARTPQNITNSVQITINKETVFKLLFCAVISRLIASADYMDDEKESIVEWISQRSSERILSIFHLHFTEANSIEKILSGNPTEHETEILDNIITHCWQIGCLDSMQLPNRLRILSQLLVEGMLIHEKSLTKEVDCVQIMISKMTGNKLLEVIGKHISENPYQFLLHVCYDGHTTKEDGELSKKIVSEFITRWQNLSEEKREEIRNESKIN